MSTNYNQLLKDLEIGSIYIKILICFLASALILYPVLFSFTHFFRGLSVYEQFFFYIGKFYHVYRNWYPSVMFKWNKISRNVLSSHIDTCDFCQYKFFHASSWLDFYFRKRPVISATTFGVRINYFI